MFIDQSKTLWFDLVQDGRLMTNWFGVYDCSWVVVSLERFHFDLFEVKCFKHKFLIAGENAPYLVLLFKSDGKLFEYSLEFQIFKK